MNHKKLTHNSIIEHLCKSGYPSYLVGGAVRDLFLGKTPHDYDVTTKATPEEISKVFRVKADTKGEAFGVMILNQIEVATFREDRYPNGNGAGNCEVQYAETIYDDLGRRDFTFNAMALCPYTGDVIDPFNGRKDLAKKMLKFVGDADLRINEDPCRILRACRFLAKLEGVFDRETFEALKRNIHLIRGVAKERVRDEILKAMETANPSIFFNALYLIGGLDYVFPTFSACVNHTHGNHHWENVWEHCMLVGDSISPKFPLVRLAGYLHDCGKPFVYNPADGSFLQHEYEGARLVWNWLGNLRFSSDDKKTVSNLVRCHMLGGSRLMTPKAIRKFRKTLADANVNPADWMRIRVADRKGSVKKDNFSFAEIRDRYSVFWFEEELPFNVNSLALKGGELITRLGLTPGPVVSKLQNYLLDYVVENGSEFNTVEALLPVAQVFLSTWEA